MGQPLSSPEDLTYWAIVAFVAALFYTILKSPTSSNYPNKPSLNTKRPKFSSEDEHSVLYKQQRLNPSGPGNPRNHLSNRNISNLPETNHSAFSGNTLPRKVEYTSTPQVRSQMGRGNNRVADERQRRSRRIINAQDISESMSDVELKFPENQGAPEAIQHYQQDGELQLSSFPFRGHSLGKGGMPDLVMPGILKDKIPTDLLRRDRAPIGVKARNASEAFQQVTSKTKSWRSGEGSLDNGFESLQRNDSKMSTENAIPELIPVIDRSLSKMEEEELVPVIGAPTKPAKLSTYPQSEERSYENRSNFSHGNFQPGALLSGGESRIRLNINNTTNQNNNQNSPKDIFLDSNALTKKENSAQLLISNLKKKSIKISSSGSAAISNYHQNSDILKKNLTDCIDLRVKLSEQEKVLKELEGKITQNPLRETFSIQDVITNVLISEPTIHHNTICLSCKNCCHEHCYLERITKNGSEAFKNCDAFLQKSTCRRCNHEYSIHVHLNSKYKKGIEVQKLYILNPPQNAQNTVQIRDSIDTVKKELKTLNEEKQKLMNNIKIFIGEMSSRDVRVCIDAVKEQLKGLLVGQLKKNCIQDIVIEIEEILARKTN